MPFARALLCTAFAIVVFGRSPASADSNPNVLFLICDDLNCDLGSYGHPQVKSPHIDKLAARGVLFDRAYCQYPVCGPSRASFMTSLYPDQTLIHANAIYLREHLPGVKTMAQMFRDHGYFASRIGKIFHYNVPKHIGTSGHDDPYSWNLTVNPRGRDVDEEDKIFSLRPGSFGATLSWLAAGGTDAEQTDGIAATEAVAQLEKFAKDGTPFFLAVGLFRPHTPYVAPKKYFDLYPLDEIEVPKVPAGYLDTLPAPARTSLTRKKDQVNLDPKLAKQAIQAYWASISFADAQVGRILDTLDATGLAENTIVLFTSDHGYHMGEHGHWQKTTLFENATRVPLVIADPRAHEKGKVALGPAEMVDFYPTLAELCNLEAPAYLSGVSLAPVFESVNGEPRQSALTQYGNGYSLRTARYRYTEWGEGGELGRELYDCRDDPGEMHNLAADESRTDLMKELSTLLHERIAAAKKKPRGLTQIVFENRRRVR